MRAGRYSVAARIYFGLPAAATRRLLSSEDSLRLGEWLRLNGHGETALVVFQRHLRDYPHGPYAAEAHLGARLVQLEDLDQPVSAYQHLLDALDLDPLPETARAARAALRRPGARFLLRHARRPAQDSHVEALPLGKLTLGAFGDTPGGDSGSASASTVSAARSGIFKSRGAMVVLIPCSPHLE